MTSFKKSLMLIALGALSAVGSTFMIDDAKILIDRALNSPTITVKYSGASAAMVEMRLNGVSVGTRDVRADRASGETNFSLDLKALRDGDNEVEVRLYDKEGKLLGTEKTTIVSDQGAKGPVYVLSPKVGAEVRGHVDIKVGFGQELSNKYVSFFVNNQFRGMTNAAPFAYTWDTTQESNGWHEVEIWVVDNEANTYKTRKVKVLVNNPGGRTTRPEPKAPVATPVAQPKTAPVTTTIPNTTATTTAVLTGALPGTVKTTGAQSGLKPVNGEAGIAMGTRTVTPTTTVVKTAVATNVAATNTVPTNKKPVIAVNTAVAVSSTAVNTTPAAPIAITRGTRLPEMGSYAVLVNAKAVNFDVQPRVENGIPLTPFRHLFEADGGEVKWDNIAKMLNAHKAGQEVTIKIGDKVARVNKIDVDLEIAPFIERGRTIVPLSFIRDGLNVDVDYDPATGHVLIKSKKS